jgi:hypothetical protein
MRREACSTAALDPLKRSSCETAAGTCSAGAHNIAEAASRLLRLIATHELVQTHTRPNWLKPVQLLLCLPQALLQQVAQR